MNVTCNADTNIMTRAQELRKRRFRIALAATGMTQASWAEKAGITPGHLSQVLAGVRDSKTLLEKVDLFAAKHAGSIAA